MELRIRVCTKQGFTLIEMLLVVVITGLLAAIAIPKFFNSKEKAYDAVAVHELRGLLTMAEAYFAENLNYPNSVADLVDYVPPSDIAITRFQLETSLGVMTVHIHLNHVNSSHYYHIRYPEDEIEKRDL
ncbi:MAG: prepilin-type N-terminal cleavage/methylation domain-containing protein [Candidatus Palauibacterales bacterium]|nr:prepilin-type N-terminal cleavage/methylation domain-containing protein [Candidatus Palauibacterales bacterium]